MGSLIIGSLFLLILLLTAIVSVAMAIDLIRKGAASKKWPAAEGKVLETGLSTTIRYNNVIDIAKIRLVYEYMVNGTSYKSTKIDFTSTRKAALFQKIEMMGLSAGKPVRVYYNPEKPGEAILEPGIHFKYITPIFFGLGALVFFFIGIYVLFING